ncbi:MAG: winged helix-turn-helix transcriptional regulator [Janthinobacterium lividum]
MHLMTGRWTCNLLRTLIQEGPLRFNELKRHVNGISTKVLTDKLRELEKANLVSRHYEPSIPPKVTYTMTDRGLELRTMFMIMDDIAHRWRKENVI